MNAPTRSPIARARGFSLIEIMVSLVVSLLLLGGMIQLYIANHRTSGIGNGVADVQEAGRFALEELAESLRMATFQGCADATRQKATVTALNSPTTDLSLTGVVGLEVAANSTWSGGPAPTNWSGVVPRPLSDVLQTQGGSRSVAALSTLMSSASDSVVLASNPDAIAAGEMVLIADCAAADLFRVTAVSSNTLTHTTSDNSSASLSKAYSATGVNAAQATRFNSWVYFVRDSGRVSADGSAIFSLFRLDTSRTGQTAQELVERVEQLQVLYGQRVPNSANINYFTAPSVTDWTQIVAVKVALLVSSHDPVLDASDTASYVLLDQTVAPAGTTGATLTYPNDRHLRRVFSTTVNIRNRRSL